MPKQTPELPLPSIQLNGTSNLPLHRQLYEQLSHAIRTGQLKPGTRLPSTRALARDLGISRTTTADAYSDLLVEGYIKSKIGAGTVVVQTLPELFLPAKTAKGSVTLKPHDNDGSPAVHTQPHLSQQGRRLADLSPSSWFFTKNELRPFRLGIGALDTTPQQAWASAIARVARHASKDQLDYQHAAGYYPLRQAVASYLAVARGVRCTADQVIIVAGTQAGLSLTTSLLLDAGDAVWMEEPGYFLAQELFQTAGVTLYPVPIDREGIVVSAGRVCAPEARLAYVTPSHQFPLGVTMSYARRRELLQWAQQTGAWIIEDDYDSEYRYAGRPIPALQGLDENGQVIYIGSFSKVFFPALRLGYIVAPPAMFDLFVAAQRVMSFHPPMMEQMAMAEFMADGGFVRHIRRMRGLYAERRDCLLTAATHYLADTLRIERTHAGLHVVGWLPDDADEHKLARLADQHGVTVYPLSAFHLGEAGRNGIVLGFAAFDEAEIKEGVQKLALAWRK